VSIGVLRAGGPHAGVVHDPATGFTCWALRGRGAHAGDALGARPGEASNVRARALDRLSPSSSAGSAGASCASSGRSRSISPTRPSARSTSCWITGPRSGTSPAARPRCSRRGAC
jgi:fructose-1,6-bisphosphatase/inositol monophosphatase family enzyme